MQSKHRYIFFAAALIIGLFTINWFTASNPMRPDISFADIDGKQHSLSQYDGKPILITFWATDCSGCIQEMPELIALHNHYSKQGLTLIDVAMSHDNLNHIKAMRKAKRLPFTIAWDEQGDIAQAFDNVRLTPTHFLISPKGEIMMRKIGTINLELLHKKLHNMGLKPA